MSLDVHLIETRPTVVFWANITHNLNEMAEAAGIYKHLWRPDELGIKNACELIEPIEKGLSDLKANPDKYRKYNAANGWGKYEDFIRWVEKYLEACKEHPDAKIEVSR